MPIIKRICSEPLGLIGLILVVLIVVSAVFAGLLAPYDPIALNITDRLQAPSLNHLLGTDQLGRDLFSRVLFGGQIALKVALIFTKFHLNRLQPTTHTQWSHL